ncbi:uncharacterized protein MELLADRAFT_102595 [Melampsora larici-populina 98AG31]|uniref:Secreted protein n=1 Tax=Melampsora larici-populina (strain 98AG31 / pathotype 3-4-7) TaxID=747676 RepID=F4R8S0_MELLP|nr:uncharacterized protein MELLADRAFT_102595 [Melampsora larici-populina 98AG31]EGG10854.1 hypothetical protein MELLADRAFT_102595 [Melampsora larici-populina 98AG31]
MTHLYFLSFYLIWLLFPLLDCSPFDIPLLAKPSVKKLDEIYGDDLKTPLLKDSSTAFQVDRQKPNRGNVKSILKFTKGGITNLVKTRTRTRIPQSQVLLSWDASYAIAQKADKPSEVSEVQAMVKTILDLGPQCNAVDINKLISRINLHSLSLEDDSLRPAERLWFVGVLSFLRSRLPEEDQKAAHSAIPDRWTAADLGRPREQFLRFFLKGTHLRMAVQDMWSEVPSKLETSEYVIQEAMQRESIVHLIRKQIRMANAANRPSAEFQRLYLAFINLDTPIESNKAFDLVASIMKHLDQPKPTEKDGFDEESNTVRLLLHLEEYHEQSYRQLHSWFKLRNFEEKIFESDVRFQLADETLAPRFKRLLKGFENPKTINEPQIINVLETLKHEQISDPQVGRLFRALDFVFNSYERGNHFRLLLDEYPQIVPRLFEMLSKRRYGRLNPRWFLHDTLEHLIYMANEDRIAKEYRNELANHLVSRGVLSKDEIVQDSEHLPRADKDPILTSMLFGIFKQVSGLNKFMRNDKDTNSILVEYILHLMIFKIDRNGLSRLVLSYKNDPERVPDYHTENFILLYKEIAQFLITKSWDVDDAFNKFAPELQKLQTRLRTYASML